MEKENPSVSSPSAPELSNLLFFTALTPVHPGSGGSFSLVDLCIQREKTTSFPFIQSSGLKGVMRDTARRVWKTSNDDPLICGIFGGTLSNSSAGCFAIAISCDQLFPPDVDIVL